MLVAPSLGPTLGREHVDQVPAIMDRRDAVIAAARDRARHRRGGVAQVLVRLIAFVTNLAFYGRFSFALRLARPATTSARA